MTSLLTNASAITALQNLNATNKSMQTTQDRISTGMRVANASDNSAYWSIATTMRSDNAALSTVKDALGLGAATVDVAAAGLKATTEVVSDIKAKLVAAREPGLDRAKVQAEVKQLQDQLKAISDSAVFSGQNWLSVDTGAADYSVTKSIVSSLSRNAGSLVIGTIDIDIASTALFDSAAQTGIIDQDRTVNATTAKVSTIDISALTDSAADLQTLDDYINIVDEALTDVTTAASDLGAAKTRIGMQTDFVSNLMDAVTKGVGQLVDADMNQESTRLQALQVQQQLGVQSLSIANQSSQQILSLFKG
ncbi:MAG: flagellin [Beijerinckiaceae bacterium]|jgi:flagellin|nr:flagellin [Beijerinckiaceae bacterium]MDO9442257.1 flagellin [Beijerinckiaceae bacterium]